MSTEKNIVRKSLDDCFIVYEKDNGKMLGRIIDLSLEGAMMISETPLPENRTIDCRINLPSSIGRGGEIEFEVESRWCRRNHRLGWFETGYAITSISRKDRETLQEIIDEFTEQVNSSARAETC